MTNEERLKKILIQLSDHINYLGSEVKDINRAIDMDESEAIAISNNMVELRREIREYFDRLPE